jgi:hypothetical protein
MLVKAFAPLLAQHSRTYYRTPVWVNVNGNRDRFSVWVGDNMARYFNRDDLPDEVKVKLAMASTSNILVNYRTDNMVMSDPNKFYMAVLPPELEHLHDVGWKMSPNCYCLILSSELIFKLRGACNDTGRESKSASEEAIG